jgi:hypothetical protein
LVFGSVFAAAVVRSTIGLLPTPSNEEKRKTYFEYLDKSSYWIALPLWYIFWPQFLGYFYYLIYEVDFQSEIEGISLLWYVAIWILIPALMLTLWAWWDAYRTDPSS